MSDTEPTVWASISTTIKTRDYENIKLDFGVAGIPLGADQATIVKALGTIQEVNEALAAELSRKLQEEFGR